MRMSILQAIGGAIYTLAVFGGLMFLPAWTLDWWRAWVVMGIALAAYVLTMRYLLPGREGLLAERYAGPIRRGQPLADKIVVILLLLTFCGAIAISGVDFSHWRLWGGVPLPLAIVGLAAFVGGWALMAIVLRENTFASPALRYQEERGQRVIDTGPYALVRHPMYAGGIFMIAGLPLWLGSWAGFFLGLACGATMVARIPIEEHFLLQHLPGYADYRRRVRWRLVPFVW